MKYYYATFVKYTGETTQNIACVLDRHPILYVLDQKDKIYLNFFCEIPEDVFKKWIAADMTALGVNFETDEG